MKKRVKARFLFLQGKLPTIEKKNKQLGFAAYKLLGQGSLSHAHRATSARPPPNAAALWSIVISGGFEFLRLY